MSGAVQMPPFLHLKQPSPPGVIPRQVGSKNPWTEEDNGWGWGHGPNEILARFACPSGFEGLLDTKGFFTTCHLAIKEPSNFMRATTEYFILILFLLSIVGFVYYRFKKFLRRRYLLKKAERRRSRKSSESSISNGPGMGGRRSSTEVG